MGSGKLNAGGAVMKNLSEKAQTLGSPAAIVARFNSLTDRAHV
jgi:hypothetical protein